MDTLLALFLTKKGAWIFWGQEGDIYLLSSIIRKAPDWQVLGQPAVAPQWCMLSARTSSSLNPKNYFWFYCYES